MDVAKTSHSHPHHADVLSAAMVAFLDGQRLGERISARIGDAIRVSTVDGDGWPLAALLSMGEVLAIDSRHVNFGIWRASGTADNIERTGRVSLSVVHEEALWEIHLVARAAAHHIGASDLAYFVGEIDAIRIHRVEFADAMNETPYRLGDPDGVIARWVQQIEELRICA